MRPRQWHLFEPCEYFIGALDGAQAQVRRTRVYSRPRTLHVHIHPPPIAERQAQPSTNEQDGKVGPGVERRQNRF